MNRKTDWGNLLLFLAGAYLVGRAVGQSQDREGVDRWLGGQKSKLLTQAGHTVVAREMRGSFDRRKLLRCQKWLRGNCLRMYGGSCEKTHRGCPYVVFGDDATPQQVGAWFLGGLYPGTYGSTARRMELDGGIR